MIYGKNLTKSTNYEIGCIIFAYSIGIGSYLYALNTNEPLWFSRSGSMMVLLAVMAEYSNYNIQLFINSAATKGSGAIGGGVGSLEQSSFRKYLSFLTHSTVAIGTFVWGYGDLFVPKA